MSPVLLQRLDAFAAATDRTRSYIVARAVEYFIAAHSRPASADEP